jgi:hypothetical protein
VRRALRLSGLAGESGLALVLAPGLMMVLAIATVATIEATVSNSQSATRDGSGNSFSIPNPRADPRSRGAEYARDG